ncbi:MAG TPA: 3-hydroxybutyrate dehydrogenase [Elusimicrobia bacterium]|nr:MAG: 3-hydroxybutyrate dehydrogenase [Elusimicrobia bacterium GWA2_66_18]HAZ09155.1 3-hydroxybutyrate dehydrogenase [Elusimicrobiota bacterium]
MLKGKTAVVTGSTSGIGLGIARGLAAQGASVMLNGFGDALEIAQMCDGLARVSGAKAAHHSADMSQPSEAAQLIRDTQAKFGGVDILVNNAGIQHVAPIEEFPAEKWDQILAVNLSSSFHTIRAALTGMKKHGWGRIINVASAHGLVGSVQKAAYVAAKHGLVGLTKVVALETAATPVTCNAVCPGWVLTPLVQKQIDAISAREKIPVSAARHKLLAEKQPSLEFATPEQLGGVVVFLCSEAAAQIRGASISVDGGWTAR